MVGYPHVAVELDGRVQHVHLSDVAALNLELAAPVRSFPAWRGKRNYDGQFWSSTTGGHVGFESLFEKTALMVLDRDPDVVGIASQPMWFYWPEGAGTRSHAPDYFVRLRSGDGIVIDVRPTDRIDDDTAEVFLRTRALCEEAGLGYWVMSDLSDALARNLRFLARFRVDAFRPPREQLDRLDRSGTELTLEELARGFEAPEAESLGWTYALLWWGFLDADLDVPLTTHSPVRVRTPGI